VIIRSLCRSVLSNIETLDGGRKCYRQIGDTMVEHTAAEMVVALKDIINKVVFGDRGVGWNEPVIVCIVQFKERLEKLNKELVDKGNEINAYKDKHSIRFMTEQEVMEFQKKKAMEEIGRIAKPQGAKGK